jgi:hypothetical protein
MRCQHDGAWQLLCEVPFVYAKIFAGISHHKFVQLNNIIIFAI